MKRVKIFGAGSIGNHLAHASRRMGWQVHVCDIDPQALHRMKNEIYPTRYGPWDEKIVLHSVDNAPRGDFDLICIGTPPDIHMKLAVDAVAEKPRAIQIEKPVCTPSLEQAEQLLSAIKNTGTRAFVGYDHVIGKAAQKSAEIISAGRLGQILTVDVDFREHWEGIFRAHPWLSGPQDSYLGYWKRGGGAGGEHSHALNLWQYFAHLAGAGRITSVDAAISYKQNGGVDYDDIFLLNLRTESGMVGRVVQDVITRPSRKSAWIQGTDASLQWINGFKDGVDAVVINPTVQGETEIYEFTKSRPDDFWEEMIHIDSAIENQEQSPLDIRRGLETMLVIAGAHISEKHKKRISIDYSRGFACDAFSLSLDN